MVEGYVKTPKSVVSLIKELPPGTLIQGHQQNPALGAGFWRFIIPIANGWLTTEPLSEDIIDRTKTPVILRNVVDGLINSAKASVDLPAIAKGK